MCFRCYILPHAVVESLVFFTLFVVVVRREWIVGGVGDPTSNEGWWQGGMGLGLVTNEQRRRPILSLVNC